MKNPHREAPPSGAKIAIIAAIITAASTIAVAFIGIVPQLREDDTSRIAALEKELGNMRRAIEAIPLGRGGTSGTSQDQAIDYMAPHIRLRRASIDTAAAMSEYLEKGRKAMDRSGFTGVGISEDVVYGYEREYTGLAWRITSGVSLFVVAGPEWKTADAKAENLRRGF